MGFFEKLKSLIIKPRATLDGKTGVISTESGIGGYDRTKEFNSTYVSCAESLARHISKIQIAVKNPNTNLSKFKYLERIFQFSPNDIQCASAMWYSVAYDYFFAGLGLVYIEWDYSDITQSKVKRLWPIGTTKIKQMKILDNRVYVQFVLENKVVCDSIDNFIVLVRSPRSSSPYNVANPSLQKIMDVLATNDEGLIKAVENSNRIQFIVQSASNKSEKMIRDDQEKFKQRLDDAENVLYISGAEHITQVNNQSKYATSTEVSEWKKEIFYSFGVNAKFLDSTFNENEWQSIYEGAIEPFITMLSQEMTNKIFSIREFDVGNRITVISNPLQTASMATRIKVGEMYCKLPVIKPNVLCDILYLPHLESGDKEVQSLNFVNANKVDAYQGVGGGKSDEDNNDDSDDSNK